ncbi:hypothetical protein D3C72_2375340 [compost metagenome]
MMERHSWVLFQLIQVTQNQYSMSMEHTEVNTTQKAYGMNTVIMEVLIQAQARLTQMLQSHQFCIIKQRLLRM